MATDRTLTAQRSSKDEIDTRLLFGHVGHATAREERADGPTGPCEGTRPIPARVRAAGTRDVCNLD